MTNSLIKWLSIDWMIWILLSEADNDYGVTSLLTCKCHQSSVKSHQSCVRVCVWCRLSCSSQWRQPCSTRAAVKRLSLSASFSIKLKHLRSTSKPKSRESPSHCVIVHTCILSLTVTKQLLLCHFYTLSSFVSDETFSLFCTLTLNDLDRLSTDRRSLHQQCVIYFV